MTKHRKIKYYNKIAQIALLIGDSEVYDIARMRENSVRLTSVSKASLNKLTNKVLVLKEQEYKFHNTRPIFMDLYKIHFNRKIKHTDVYYVYTNERGYEMSVNLMSDFNSFKFRRTANYVQFEPKRVRVYANAWFVVSGFKKGDVVTLYFK